MKKRLINLIFTIYIFSVFFPLKSELSFYQFNTKTFDSVTNETLAQRYIWRFKKINGKLYKRLYDNNACKWIGDWIPVENGLDILV